MWSKLYFAALGLSIGVMVFFTFYSWSWLQSIGLPAAAVEGYHYHSNLGWITLWISFVALLLLGNAVIWATESSWAMWATSVYFGVFVLLQYFWLEQSAFQFKKAHGFSEGSLSITPLMGVIYLSAAAAVVYIDQFVIVRLYRRMYPTIISEETIPEVKTESKSDS